MMRYLLLCLWLLTAPAWAHTIDYQVDSAKALVITVRFSDDEPASFSEYEVLPPPKAGSQSKEILPFQTGRSDQLGRVVFAPDRAGKWTIKVKADSQHGLHGKVVEVEVGTDMVVLNYNRPVVARSTRLLVGVSLLLGVFGLLSLFKRRAPQATNP